MQSEVIKNHFGYYELKHKPSPEQLQDYYEKKYYQNNSKSYNHEYSEEELAYISNKITQKSQVINQLLSIPQEHKPKLLDIGCGEGWALQYFANLGWDVVGVDYSEFGCNTHNPSMINNLITGEITENLHTLVNDLQKFDLIWLDNVLEHVLEPEELLNVCNKLVNDRGLLVIEVPNDFSSVQEHLLDQGLISRSFWVAVPDHISYFNKVGLNRLCDQCGWTTKKNMGDFPIDFNLFNERTNYIENSDAGGNCHLSRIRIENFLHHISVDKTNQLYEVLADMGLGRQIIGFYGRKLDE
jgi:2-polyprenyl-3-methyl-5-hydroxy-6-metoxy-1,4-benzoquinol methylase